MGDSSRHIRRNHRRWGTCQFRTAEKSSREAVNSPKRWFSAEREVISGSNPKKASISTLAEEEPFKTRNEIMVSGVIFRVRSKPFRICNNGIHGK